MVFLCLFYGLLDRPLFAAVAERRFRSFLLYLFPIDGLSRGTDVPKTLALKWYREAEKK